MTVGGLLTKLDADDVAQAHASAFSADITAEEIRQFQEEVRAHAEDYARRLIRRHASRPHPGRFRGMASFHWRTLQPYGGDHG